MTLSALPLAACRTYYAAPLTSTSGCVLADDEALVQITSLPGKRPLGLGAVTDPVSEVEAIVEHAVARIAER
jgi:hypothetical protein